MNKHAVRITCLVFLACLAFATPARTEDMSLRLVKTLNSFSGLGLFKNLRGMWLDKSEGTFFILDENPLTVFKFDRSGNPIKYYRIENLDLPDVQIAGTTPGGAVYLHSPKGLFLVSADLSSATRVEFHFSAPASTPGAEPVVVPLDFMRVFVSENGNLFGFDPQKNILYECDETHACRVFIRTVMKYGPNVLTGHMKFVFRDPWDRFFFVDEQERQVWKFTEGGDFIGPAVERLDPLQNRFFTPEFVTVDREKKCYIYDSGIHSIKVYDDLGLPVAQIDTHPPQGPLFLFPVFFDIDDYKNLYVLDRGDMTVKIFEVIDQTF